MIITHALVMFRDTEGRLIWYAGTVSPDAVRVNGEIRWSDHKEGDQTPSPTTEGSGFKYPPPAPERIYGASDDPEFPSG